MDFEQNLQNKWHAFTDDARHLQQSKEAEYAHLNTGMRLKSSCALPVLIVQNGGQTDSLWDCNDETERQGLQPTDRTENSNFQWIKNIKVHKMCGFLMLQVTVT